MLYRLVACAAIVASASAAVPRTSLDTQLEALSLKVRATNDHNDKDVHAASIAAHKVTLAKVQKHGGYKQLKAKLAHAQKHVTAKKVKTKVGHIKTKGVKKEQAEERFEGEPDEEAAWIKDHTAPEEEAEEEAPAEEAPAEEVPPEEEADIEKKHEEEVASGAADTGTDEGALQA